MSLKYATFPGALLALASCSSANRGASGDPPCPGVVQSPIVGGAASESYLGLGPNQRRAVVEIVDGAKWIPADAGATSGGLCSGTFVSPAWVVTAQHCLQLSNLAVVVGGGGQGASPALWPVLRAVGHPTEDVALLEVAAPALEAGVAAAGVAGIEPLAAGGPSVAKLASGDVVEIAGYGYTQTGATGGLHFVAEPLVAVDSSTLSVDGAGASGACEGDSGGPLLVRGPSGAPTVAGVLSLGSATCNGADDYVRLDSVQGWIDSTVGPAGPNDADCGTISEQGRCLYGSAVWCAVGQIASETCAGATRCGWDPRQAGFRCVDPSMDPCDGADSVGACQAGAVLRCNGGTLERHACSACETCRIDGVTGGPMCASPVASGGGM